MNKINSPEQLNDYIKVSNPSIFIVLIAMLILIVSVVVWSFTWKFSNDIVAVGVAENELIVCYIPTDKISDIKIGMKVKVNDEIVGEVKAISDTPLSAGEVKSIYQSDYIISMLSLSEWNTKISIEVAGLENSNLYSLSIVVDEVRPIDFLLN